MIEIDDNSVKPRNVCVNMSGEMKCKKPLLIKVQNGMFEMDCAVKGCVDSTKTAVAFANADDQFRCAKIDLITHCESYVDTTTPNIKIECSKCRNDYYLTKNTCVKRTIVSNCTTYNPTADECATCATSFVLVGKKL